MSQRPLEVGDPVTPAAAAKRPDAALRERVTLRLATHDDVEALVHMINDAYMREAWLLPPPRVDVPSLQEELDEPETRMIVAEIDGQIAGSVCLSLHDEPDFGLFAVATPWQGRGIASLLIAEAERVARREGRALMRLDCARELGMVPFYESLGYVVEREVPGHFYGRNGVRKGPVTRVDMIKRLR